MIDYVSGLFPQAAGVPPSAPPPCALFESFFGRPERLLLPQCLASYAVRGVCSLGRAVPVIEFLLSHFARIYRRGLPFVTLWLWRPPAELSRRLSPILCGCSRGC